MAKNYIIFCRFVSMVCHEILAYMKISND